MSRHNSQAIILFDGVCNLCNYSVQFIIKHDPKAYFRFASLQSESGARLLDKHNLASNPFQSVILISNDRVYNRSSAALNIAKKLNGAWPLLYIFIITPPFVRNAIYDWIANNRYKWFGKRNECMIPTPDLKSRFINP